MDTTSSSFEYRSERRSARDERVDRALVVPLHRAELRRVIPEWNRLAERTHAVPFALPAFVMATARHLAVGEHLVAAAIRGRELVGVLPVTRRGRTLLPTASDHTPRFDFVGERGAVRAVLDALLGLRGWDVLHLPRVPSGSWLARDLPAHATAAGCNVIVQPRTRSPRFALDAFEARLTSKFRGELRRAESRLGAIGYERVDRFDPAAFREALELEQRAWKGAEGTAMASDPSTLRFYTTIARWAARRRALTLGFLRLGERRVAMHLAIEASGTYYLLKPGYDPEFAAHSPGQLLLKLAAVDARARGLHTVDLLGRDDAWKRKWTDDVTEHSSVVVYRNTPLGQARFVASAKCRPVLGQARRWMRDRITAQRRQEICREKCRDTCRDT